MTEDRYVAAIEISSSKIVAIVGRTRSDGRLDIIATDLEKGLESVRYGVITNAEEAAMRINRIINRLERKPVVSPRRITGFFVGLSGKSLRSIPTRITINLPEDTEITDSIISRLQQQALSTAIDSSLEVIDAVPRSYTVGRMETATPRGMVGNSISADFDIIACKPFLKSGVVRAIREKLNIPIKGVVVTALATGQLILSAEEKRLGCMLVDMGAETTTVSIYKNGHLTYFATLPLGGRNITRDLTTLNILEEYAEELKITSGNVMPKAPASQLNYNGVRETDVSNIIVARAEEIVVNILKQIQYAELNDSDLPGGIVVIGGTSKLNGIIDMLAEKSGLNVRRGALPNYISLEDTKISSAEIVEVASVLYAGAQSSDVECLERPERNEVPVTGTADPEPEEQSEPEHTPKNPGIKTPKWWDRFKNGVSNAFGNTEDDSDRLD